MAAGFSLFLAACWAEVGGRAGRSDRTPSFESNRPQQSKIIMHYKNGRPAVNGDPVIGFNYNGKVTSGVIHNLCEQAQGPCNCDLATLIPGGVLNLTCQDVNKMYHAEDAYLAVDRPTIPAAIVQTAGTDTPSSAGNPDHAFKPAATLVTLLIVTLLLALAPKAKAAFDFGTLTNAVTTIGGISNSIASGVLTNSTAASQAISVHAGSYLLVCPRFAGNTAVSNIVFGLDVFNGTSWTTTFPLAVTNNPLAGGLTVQTVGYAVFTPAQLAGATQVRWDYLSTGGSNQVYGLDYSWLY